MKLTIELVPKTAWYSNVRSNVTASKWDKRSKYNWELDITYLDNYLL